MTLTEEERAYLRRMCYETAHGLFGPGTTFANNTTPDHTQYQDLVDLATPEIQREQDWWSLSPEGAPALVDFPWATPQALHERADEMRRNDTIVT